MRKELLTPEEKSALCLKCQYCCKVAFIPVNPHSGLVSFYRDVRGIEVRFTEGLNPWFVVNQPCQHLTPKGCRIYDKRPVDCKFFDGREMLFNREKCLWYQVEQERKANICQVQKM